MALRFVHPAGPSLIAKVSRPMFRDMFGKLFIQRIAAVVVALGIFLSGAASAWAIPMAGSQKTVPGVTMTMPGMTMANCMDMAGKNAPAKQAPCKGSDSSCAVCSNCAVNVGLVPEISPAAFLYQRSSGVFARAVNPDGIASPPALPPPILHV
jgi:hypothetical protein